LPTLLSDILFDCCVHTDTLLPFVLTTATEFEHRISVSKVYHVCLHFGVHIEQVMLYSETCYDYSKIIY